MANLKRSRYGSVITGAELVDIGDTPRSLAEHAERLDDIADTLIGLRLHGSTIPDEAIAKALCCGRIMSGGTRGMYQPCIYCRQTAICPTCQYLAARGHALDCIDDLKRYGRTLVVFDLLFTVPLANDPDEEVFQVNFVNKAIDYLMRYRKRQSSIEFERDSNDRILRAIISMHMNPTAPGGLVRPHLHCLFFAQPKIVFKDLRAKLKGWWEKETFKHFGRKGHCNIDHLGRLGAPSRTSNRPKKPITFAWLENKLIYNIVQMKRGESAVDTIHRRDLFYRLGIDRTTRRSRLIVSSAERNTLPHEFDPAMLGHAKMCVSRLHGGLPVLRPVSDYAKVKAQLFASTYELLESAAQDGGN